MHNKIWHIVTATHDSRTSKRMITYQVRQRRDHGRRPVADPILLELEDELLIASKMAEIAEKYDLKILAYNICRDHAHILMACESEKLHRTVGMIKAITGRAYNIAKGRTVPRPGGLVQGDMSPCHTGTENISPKKKKKHNSLWTQKFYHEEITDQDHLKTLFDYIRKNRIKHELPESEELIRIINSFLCTMEEAIEDGSSKK